VSQKVISSSLGLEILLRGSANADMAIANKTGSPALVFHEDAAATQIDTWTQWRIDLQQFADQGINLSDVDSISIGIGDRNNSGAGGSDQMFFDDLRLYPSTAGPEPVQP